MQDAGDEILRALEADLERVEAEIADLANQHRMLNAALDKKRTYREALLEVIRQRRPASDVTPKVSAAAQPLTIRQHAVDFAKQNGNFLRVTVFFRLVRDLGFKSDSGGIYTILSNAREFRKSAPGEFEYIGP